MGDESIIFLMMALVMNMRGLQPAEEPGDACHLRTSTPWSSQHLFDYACLGPSDSRILCAGHVHLA